MGKNDSTVVPASTPEFTPTTVRYNGVDISKTYKDSSGNVITEYLESPEDKELREWRESQISEFEPQLNVFSPELQQSWEDIATAKKNQALDEFNALWDPIAKSTREDLWSRGLANSSIAADTQKAQDEIKANALEDIANDYVAEKEDLKNDELASRYLYLNYLSGGLEDMSQDAFSLLTSSLNNSNSVNSNNTDVWKTQLAQYNYENQNSNSKNGWFTSLF